MQDSKIEPENEPSSWRQRLLVGSVVLVAGMYLRRRVSGSRDRQTEAETESSTGSASRGGRGIGGRIKMLVISTLVFAIARSVVRRLKRRR